MNCDFKEKLLRAADNVLFDEPMSAHTTFRIGGPAEAFVTVNDTKELISVLRLCREENEKVTVVGNGSNMLVGDSGISGVVIKTGGEFLKIDITGKKAVAGSGVLMSKFCSQLAKSGLSGLEFAAGIPGSMGGGVYMNAGAYGGSLSDRLVNVKYIDEDLKLCEKESKDLELGYRHTFFTGKNCIITECEFELEYGPEAEICRKIAEYNKMRSDKQPLEFPSAGSTFKRPEGYFAGKLIEDSGLKGYSVGGAQVSEKHAGFVINKGGATAADVLRLIEHIKSVVHDKYGVELEEEIRLIEG